MLLCNRCHRHIRETLCPFCGAEDSTSRGALASMTPGIKRAALIVGTVALAACSAQPVYGIPIDASDNDAAAAEASVEAGEQDVSPAPAYGIMPPDSGR